MMKGTFTGSQFYIEESQKEILCILKNYLSKRNLTLNQYMSTLVKSDYQVDELFFVLVPKHFEKHITVILGMDSFWCTSPFKNIHSSDLIYIAT